MATLNTNSRILIVDDFEIVRLMLKNSLVELGYSQLEEAEDGNVAIHKLREGLEIGSPFSLIFSDWNMPNCNGLEFLQACRRHKDFRDIPFVMVTAEAEQEYVIQALRAGATDYIVKPFSQESLQKKIEKLSKKLSGNG